MISHAFCLDAAWLSGLPLVRCATMEMDRRHAKPQSGHVWAFQAILTLLVAGVFQNISLAVEDK